MMCVPFSNLREVKSFERIKLFSIYCENCTRSFLDDWELVDE